MKLQAVEPQKGFSSPSHPPAQVLSQAQPFQAALSGMDQGELSMQFLL